MLCPIDASAAEPNAVPAEWIKIPPDKPSWQYAESDHIYLE